MTRPNTPPPSKRQIRGQLRDISQSLRGVRVALEDDVIDIGATLARSNREPGGVVRRALTIEEQQIRYERALEGVAVAQRALARLYTQVERRKRAIDATIDTRRTA